MCCSRLPSDRRALLTLVLAGGATAPRRRLLEQHGDPESALAATPAHWRQAGCDVRQIAALRQPDCSSTATALDWLDDSRCTLIGWHDADYPSLLRQISNPPLALFVEGDPNLLWHPAVAVVGSRNPSAGGRDNARAFAAELAASGIGLTSGLAAGVDTLVHQTALDNRGITTAVLGTGPNLSYPSHNHLLHRHIAGSGVVVSEYPPGIRARPAHFPARNRIIAGLSLGTLVVEAAVQSGALITARLANEAGREVFAIPGSIHNPMARGCHQLIRDGATLVQDAGQVLNGVAIPASALADALRKRLDNIIQKPSSVPIQSLPTLNSDHENLWQALGHDPTPMATLVERTGLTAAALSSMLLVMELDGSVVLEHGRYARTPGFSTSTASSDAGRGQ